MSDFFNNLDEIEVSDSQQDVRWQTGEYIVRFVGCKDIKDGFKGDSLILRAEVMHSESDHAEAPLPGQTSGQVLKTAGPNAKYAKEDWIKFLCGNLQCKPGDHTGAEWKTVSKKILDGGFNGRIFHLTVATKTNDNTGKTFTHMYWHGKPSPQQAARLGYTPEA